MNLPTWIEQAIRQAMAAHDGPMCAYVYDLGALRAHARRLVTTLPERCRLFYAIKANSDPSILRALSGLVSGFEVASIGEAKRAREAKASIPIMFGGPGKTDEELAEAIRLGIQTLHVESVHELRRVQYIAGGLDKQVSVLLRVNIRGALPTSTLRMGGSATQFGLDETDVPEAIALAQASPQSVLRGFHFHSVSNNLDAVSHVELVRDYLRRAKHWARVFGLRVDYVNAGGGIGVNYGALEQQFDWPAFVRGLKEVVEGNGLLRDGSILFECGRYLTAFCGYYAAEVLDLKRNHGKPFVIVRGGTHHCRLPASWQHSQPFTVLPVDSWSYPFPRPEIRGEPVTIAGQLCTPKDILARECLIDRVRVGDVIVFHLVGAYGWSISHHDFLSHPHPARLYVDDEEIEMMKVGAFGTMDGRSS
jgi:2-[(L-alanin-3-ylcarbamoyl)methyl]-2-hydroxybutanedioate decarboxylase